MPWDGMGWILENGNGWRNGRRKEGIEKGWVGRETRPGVLIFFWSGEDLSDTLVYGFYPLPKSFPFCFRAAFIEYTVSAVMIP